MRRLLTLAAALAFASPAAAQFGETRSILSGCNTYFCTVIDMISGYREDESEGCCIGYYQSFTVNVSLTALAQSRGINELYVRGGASGGEEGGIAGEAAFDFFRSLPNLATYQGFLYEQEALRRIDLIEGFAARSERGEDGVIRYTFSENVRNALVPADVTTTPEPATFALVAGGLALVGVAARGRRA